MFHEPLLFGGMLRADDYLGKYSTFNVNNQYSNGSRSTRNILDKKIFLTHLLRVQTAATASFGKNIIKNKNDAGVLLSIEN